MNSTSTAKTTSFEGRLDIMEMAGLLRFYYDSHIHVSTRSHLLRLISGDLHNTLLEGKLLVPFTDLHQAVDYINRTIGFSKRGAHLNKHVRYAPIEFGGKSASQQGEQPTQEELYDMAESALRNLGLPVPNYKRLTREELDAQGTAQKMNRPVTVGPKDTPFTHSVEDDTLDTTTVDEPDVGEEAENNT